MEFFDLNIPYHEKEALIAGDKDKAAKKATRLKTLVKAMELGYTGIAYDRLLKGVMSDKDRCGITPFPVSSLLKAAPSLMDSVKFHRQLLRVPSSATFRQYRRMTVVVDSVVGASVLNAGNPVLKSYDLVAVRPTNQTAFEQVCRAAEVDLIAIDFSQKLPFRLKYPIVNAAIERGIYFEITYSQLISSAPSRREMLPNAKMLVNWTRGKNLIISSAAPTASEVRGPYDVINLFSLLGLSTERAKAAVSRNCRSLLANALRKKQCYKEAIRVERVSSTELNSNGDLLSRWNHWDPISSGDGDLPSLDDFAKLLSNATNVRQKVPIRCFSNQCAPVPENKMHENQTCDEDISSQNIQTSFSHEAILKPVSSMSESQVPDRPGSSMAAEELPFPVRPSTSSEDDLQPTSRPSMFSTSSVEPDAVVTEKVDLITSRTYNLACEVDLNPISYMSSEDTAVKNTVQSGFPNEKERECLLHPKLANVLDEENILSNCTDTLVKAISSHYKCDEEDGNRRLMVQSCSMHGSSMDVDSLYLHDRDAKFLTQQDVGSKSGDILSDKATIQPKVLNHEDFSLPACITSAHECHSGIPLNEQQDVAVPTTEENADKNVAENQGNVLNDVQMENIEEEQQQCGAAPCIPEEKHKSGKSRFKQKRKHQLFPFPSRGFLNPLLFKKNVLRAKGSKNLHAGINGKKLKNEVGIHPT